MPEKVLVVEDSPTEALRTRVILEQHGYEVSLAVDGREALARATEERPDLIVLDTIMPRMSGHEAYTRLRIDPRTARIPVLLLLTDVQAGNGSTESSGRAVRLSAHDEAVRLSAHDEAAGRGRAKVVPGRLGDTCDLYIPKPFDPPLLLEGVETVIRKAREVAAVAAQVKTEFLSTMSHELRTPLHEIMGTVDLVLDTDLSLEQREYLQTTRRSAQSLLDIVSDILEFADLETEQLGPTAERFDLAQTLLEVVARLRSKAEEKGLLLQHHVAPDVPAELVGDVARLRRLLFKLLDNAVKFTEEGKIVVSVQCMVDREPAADHAPLVNVHFSISDTGIGIPHDRQEIIFEMFRQADGSLTRRHGSVGLGLAAAVQLAALLGGRIWVESEGIPGQGSTFHVVVPLRRVELSQTANPGLIVRGSAEPATSPRPEARPEGSVESAHPKPAQSNGTQDIQEMLPLRILVAEDSPTNQLIARVNLTKAGHWVHIADNGHKAVEAWRQEDFDIILMDVAMPEMDGLEATQLIREQELESGNHIPIVAMTAFAMKEYEEKCQQAGMDAFVTKPVSPEALHRAIEPLLRQANATVCAAPAAPPSPALPPSANGADRGREQEPPAEPPVDMAAAMEVVAGDLDLMEAVSEMFLEEYPGLFEVLGEAVAAQDAVAVEATAHRLKGILGNVGSVAARALAQRLEDMGEEAHLHEAAAVLAVLRQETERVVAFYTQPDWQTVAAQYQED